MGNYFYQEQEVLIVPSPLAKLPKRPKALILPPSLPKTMPKPPSVKHHIEHSPSPIYKCKRCLREFKSEGNLGAHFWCFKKPLK